MCGDVHDSEVAVGGRPHAVDRRVARVRSRHGLTIDRVNREVRIDGHPYAKASRQVGPVRQGAHHDPGPRLPIRSRSGRALHGRHSSGLSAYSVAVYGPAGWQIGLGGFPVDEHPLPEEVYVAPGR
jgi:hypothetical protein